MQTHALESEHTELMYVSVLIYSFTHIVGYSFTLLKPLQNILVQNAHDPRPRALPILHQRRLPHHHFLPRHPPRLKQVLPVQFLERPPPHDLPISPSHHNPDGDFEMRRPLLRRWEREVAHHQDATTYHGSGVGGRDHEDGCQG